MAEYNFSEVALGMAFVFQLSWQYFTVDNYLNVCHAMPLPKKLWGLLLFLKLLCT